MNYFEYLSNNMSTFDFWSSVSNFATSGGSSTFNTTFCWTLGSGFELSAWDLSLVFCVSGGTAAVGLPSVSAGGEGRVDFGRSSLSDENLLFLVCCTGVGSVFAFFSVLSKFSSFLNFCSLALNLRSRSSRCFSFAAFCALCCSSLFLVN